MGRHVTELIVRRQKSPVRTLITLALREVDSRTKKERAKDVVVAVLQAQRGWVGYHAVIDLLVKYGPLAASTAYYAVLELESEGRIERRGEAVPTRQYRAVS